MSFTSAEDDELDRIRQKYYDQVKEILKGCEVMPEDQLSEEVSNRRKKVNAVMLKYDNLLNRLLKNKKKNVKLQEFSAIIDEIIDISNTKEYEDTFLVLDPKGFYLPYDFEWAIGAYVTDDINDIIKFHIIPKTRIKNYVDLKKLVHDYWGFGDFECRTETKKFIQKKLNFKCELWSNHYSTF
jgi:hypothetical protein